VTFKSIVGHNTSTVVVFSIKQGDTFLNIDQLWPIAKELNVTFQHLVQKSCSFSIFPREGKIEVVNLQSLTAVCAIFAIASFMAFVLICAVILLRNEALYRKGRMYFYLLLTGIPLMFCMEVFFMLGKPTLLSCISRQALSVTASGSLTG
jgi:ABC-type maltose transport system permease subunit